MKPLAGDCPREGCDGRLQNRREVGEWVEICLSCGREPPLDPEQPELHKVYGNGVCILDIPDVGPPPAPESGLLEAIRHRRKAAGAIPTPLVLPATTKLPAQAMMDFGRTVQKTE